MGTPTTDVAGAGDLALGLRSSVVEQEEAGEEGSHEDSKIQAPISGGRKRHDGCAGVEMATLPAEIVPKELIGHEAERQRSKHADSRSVDATNSLLLKRKSSTGNVPKPPADKRRRNSSALHMQFARSPLLNRMLVSPRTRHCGAKHLSRLSSSTLPDKGRAASSTSWLTPNDGNNIEPVSRSVISCPSLCSWLQL